MYPCRVLIKIMRSCFSLVVFLTTDDLLIPCTKNCHKAITKTNLSYIAKV